MQYKKIIEDNFLIDDEFGKYVPFKFREVQSKYYEQLQKEYSEKDNFNNLREIILKARKEGFTSLWLGIFCADIVLSKDPVRYLEISYKEDATSQHFRRAKGYILSFFEKNPRKWTKELDRQVFSSITDGNEFVLRHNGASFYVGTASTKTGERGGTIKGCLFTESAHFPDTGIISAAEIIEGTQSMVAVGSGMIIHESTANGFNHFKKRWEMAKSREINYRPRFFSWRDFYSEEQFKEVCLGFTDKRIIKQEFPDNDLEAFLTSGETYFDQEAMQFYFEHFKTTPMVSGYIYGGMQ